MLEEERCVLRDYLAKNWSKSYGIKDILKEVSFLVREGDHIGLIGPNGSGKSTLLQIIAGYDNVDSGEVDHQNDFTIGLVKQDPNLDDQQTVFEAVYMSNSPLVQVVRAYEEAANDLAKAPDDPQKQAAYKRCEQAMNTKNGWQLETKIQTILSKLQIKDIYQPVGQLSGGQKRRVGMAKVLIDEPDLLLLDEPTNHMDFEMVEWLENYIGQYKKSVIVVTHDRYFLDRISKRIFALEGGELREYHGNYQDYLDKRAIECEVAQSTREKQKKLYKQELAWMRQGAQARSTKQEARIHRFEDLKESLNQPTLTRQNLTIDLDQERLGKKVITLDHVSVGYDKGKPLLEDINLLIQKSDRIGIIGGNGVGKTSLLHTIAGLIPCLEGTIDLGSTVKLAYFQQLPDNLPEDKRVITYIQEVADEFVYSDGRKLSASQMLETFLFDRQTHGQFIGKLSGGEKKRLYLLKLLMSRPNVLFLDEPTNDLDIDTLTVLEDYLKTFPGAVITVSHDRYFLDKVVDKLLIATDHHCQLFYGNYSDYQVAQKEESKKQKESQPKSSTKASAKTDKPKKKMTYQEKKDWETIEEDIMALEESIQAIDEEMMVCGSDYGKLADLQKEKESQQEELLDKMTYWDYLSELAQ
ncbi:ABC transporter, ATP-binding protein [Aerococcus christensenii]|uniref:ABC transporter, ATP-binding protein n=1 Tax=Aerococcus christensenii TaxID=87541 RepID=A0A133Y0W2_9LACT|nr:ABC transporter, ATP-binding protein [Aerococcus christensenii]